MLVLGADAPQRTICIIPQTPAAFANPFSASG
jgi:hypothetical protein